jgi:hypothetical protein
MLALLLACLLAAQPKKPSTPPKPPEPPPPATLVEQANLEAAIRALPLQRSAGWTAEHEAGLVKTQEWLVEQLKAMTLEPRTQEVRFSKRLRPTPAMPRADYKRDWQNIIVEIPGKEIPGEVLIVGAHFDAVPDAPGADDNATGVAALLEIARVLKDRPMRRTLRLVFFNLEEAGLAGSNQYVASLPSEEDASRPKIIGMMSLEMLGFYSDKPDSQGNPFRAIKGVELPTVGDFVGLAGLLGSRPFIRTLDEQMRKAEPQCKTVVFDMSPIPLPDLLRSDHAPFMSAGIPAVMVTDTANFRNRNYHRPSDTIETLDLARYTLTVRALVGAVHAMAGPVGKPDPAAPNLEGLPDLRQLFAPEEPEPQPAPIEPVEPVAPEPVAPVPTAPAPVAPTTPK